MGRFKNTTWIEISGKNIAYRKFCWSDEEKVYLVLAMDFNILLLTELLTQELFCVFLPEDPLYKTSSVQFHLRVTLEIFFLMSTVWT